MCRGSHQAEHSYHLSSPTATLCMVQLSIRRAKLLYILLLELASSMSGHDEECRIY